MTEIQQTTDKIKIHQQTRTFNCWLKAQKRKYCNNLSNNLQDFWHKN